MENLELIKNIKIANMVQEKLEEKNIYLDFDKIYIIIDDSIYYDKDLIKDEWGDIKDISKKDLDILVKNLTKGIIQGLEYNEFEEIFNYYDD